MSKLTVIETKCFWRVTATHYYIPIAFKRRFQVAASQYSLEAVPDFPCLIHGFPTFVMVLPHLLDFKSHLASFETVVEISADRVNDAEWGISAEIGATCHVTCPRPRKKFED